MVQRGACNAIGCRARVLPSELFCERHDRMLQSDIRTILLRQARPGPRQTLVFQATLDRAREEILYAQHAGHRVPREQDFEW